MRVPSPIKTRDGRGNIHRLGPGRPPSTIGSDRFDDFKLKFAECVTLQRRFVADLSEARSHQLAKSLGVSERSLRLLGLGWNVERACFTFPMRDNAGNIVGIRTRDPVDGSKRCVKGSRLGLIHADADRSLVPGWLMITEGESDCAAAMDLGFVAVARPGCEACFDLVVNHVRQLAPERVAVVADRDAPGQRGARSLAMKIAAATRRPAVIFTPPGAKDLRAWKSQADASHHDVLSMLENL